MSPKLDEKILIDKVLSGNQKAFIELIRRYERLVYHVIFRLIPNKDNHEDIGQDVFIKIYTKLGSFKGESKLSTWIARIAYNTCINFLEKKRISLLDDVVKKIDDEDEFQESSISKVESGNDLPDMEVEKGFSNELLQEAIAQLPAKFKIILTLFHIEEMKYKEISEITNLPEGTVKSYLFRARKMLRECLEKKYSVEDLCH